MYKQKGFTLTEIMIAVGVVSALMINGYNFYNNSVAKSQANEALTAAKKIADGISDYYARFDSLPTSEGFMDNTANLDGFYHPNINQELHLPDVPAAGRG